MTSFPVVLSRTRWKLIADLIDEALEMLEQSPDESMIDVTDELSVSSQTIRIEIEKYKKRRATH